MRSVDYGESDRIVTLYTRDVGKVSAMARGARKSRKRFAGALEPFTRIEVELSLSSAELAGLSNARALVLYEGILADLAAVNVAGLGMWLVREATPQRETDARIFQATQAFLERLHVLKVGREDVLLAFETRMLALMGLEPSLDRCGVCDRDAGDRAALFDASRGTVVCRSCGGARYLLSASTRARLKEAGTARFLEGEPWTSRERDEARPALRAAIEAQLGKNMPMLEGDPS